MFANEMRTFKTLKFWSNFKGVLCTSPLFKIRNISQISSKENQLLLTFGDSTFCTLRDKTSEK
jgi:hypothetical protein